MTLLTKDNAPLHEHAMFVRFDEKAVSAEGEIEGYASVFGQLDQGDDVVLPGAFRECLKNRTPRDIKLLWQHNPHEVIGKWTELREDGKGLYAKGQLFSKIQRGQEAIELAREGAVDGLSIGYRTKVSEFDTDTGVRLLKELDLREVSLVTFPMLETARVSAVKELSDLKTIRDYEEALRNGTLPPLSQRAAKQLLSGGYNAMNIARDADEDGEDEDIAKFLAELAAVLTAQ